MLIEFRGSNFRSLGDEQVLSLVPSSKHSECVDSTIFTKEKYEALSVVSIYGANASGKSNLIKAMKLFDRIVHLSARSSSTTVLPYDPFLLREGYNLKPTEFEITFITENNIRYRYGFSFNQKDILSEWLYRKKIGREVSLFVRENDIIDVSSGFNGASKLIEASIEATRNNALFLSTCDMLNVEEAKNIFQWFKYFNVVDGLETEIEEITTVNLWEQEEYRAKIKNYLLALNLGFKDINIATKKFEEKDLPENIDKSTRQSLIGQLEGSTGFLVKTIHQLYNEFGKQSMQTIEWDMDKRESSGTKKAFHLSGPILWALTNGGILIIDEIEAKMHPIMTLDTINLFLSAETNPNKAQLIYTTHDTNLMTYLNIGRDQIYLTEKNNWESTELYSLSDIQYKDPKKEHPDTDREKRYLEGRYGAIPVFGSFLSILNK
ncbi:ATP-binding protein [Bacteroides sp. 214]|uniref:AAA family ATPase n=1 Tax=Bacteroides sp. 214 TaxID=2302935 RepID=UPI0013D2428A|nr:ATP-binding protein [Bacteroides sp. 214]NDW11977.1 ATP-binding protein [Bacteroides sp. 214]